MQSDVSGHDHRVSSRLMMLDYAVTVSDHLKLKTGVSNSNNHQISQDWASFV